MTQGATWPQSRSSSTLLNPAAQVWLRGGWAVDLTLGRITRRHADIDWFAALPAKAELLAGLMGRGFRRTGSAPEDQQADLIRGRIEHGIAWITIRDGEAFVSGGPWAAAPWPRGMLRGRTRQLDDVRAPVISAEAQIEIKQMTPTWQPHLPRRDKDHVDIALLQEEQARWHS